MNENKLSTGKPQSKNLSQTASSILKHTKKGKGKEKRGNPRGDRLIILHLELGNFLGVRRGDAVRVRMKFADPQRYYQDSHL